MELSNYHKFISLQVKMLRLKVKVHQEVSSLILSGFFPRDVSSTGGEKYLFLSLAGEKSSLNSI